MPKQFVSIKQLRERVPISRETAAQWCKSGRLPAVKLGNKWFIRADKLEEILGGGEIKNAQ